MIASQLKTVLLLGSLSGLLLALGYFVRGASGMTFALVISLLMNLGMYFYSEKIVLSMYSAKPLDKKQYAEIHEIVEELSAKNNMPKPKLWLVDNKMANAFATGRNPENASVVVTQGILGLLDQRELRGVLAHELAHVKNRDVLVATVAATMATAIGYVATMMRWSLIFGGSKESRRGGLLATIAVSILVPIMATLIQFAVSRSREYLADETGAHTCEDPEALASALQKLDHHSKAVPAKEVTPSQASVASLFIVYPFSGSSLYDLFSTHPPMRERIARLRAMK